MTVDPGDAVTPAQSVVRTQKPQHVIKTAQPLCLVAGDGGGTVLHPQGGTVKTASGSGDSSGDIAPESGCILP